MFISFAESSTFKGSGLQTNMVNVTLELSDSLLLHLASDWVSWHTVSLFHYCLKLVLKIHLRITILSYHSSVYRQFPSFLCSQFLSILQLFPHKTYYSLWHQVSMQAVKLIAKSEYELLTIVLAYQHYPIDFLLSTNSEQDSELLKFSPPLVLNYLNRDHFR